MDAITSIPGVLLTPLKRVTVEKGGVMHLMRKVDAGFNGFGEAYISTVCNGMIKGWRRHRQMTLNLIVPVGEIEFRAVDNRISPAQFTTGAVCLSSTNYHRLTVPAGVWLSFRGLGPDLNMLINIADIIHDPVEADSLPIGTPALPDVWASEIT